MFKPAALLLLATTMASAAQAQPEPNAIKRSEDFCFVRTYGAKHFAAHPKQIVSSIQIMGRNAWTSSEGPGNALYASLLVRFRNEDKPLMMNGVCRPAEGQSADTTSLSCKFFLDKMQDVLASQIRMAWPRPGAMHVTASGDWKVLRRGQAPDGSYGTITTDDRAFELTRRPPAACRFAKNLWTAKGPTKAMIEMLP